MLHWAWERDGRARDALEVEPRASSVRHPLQAEIDCISRLPERLLPEWQALVEAAAEPNSFMEPWFVEASLRHLAPAGGVRLLTVRENGCLLGLALFDTSCRYGRAPIRHVENWRHHNQFLGAPLVRRGREADFWRAALVALDRAEWAPGFLHVTALVEHGPLHAGLEAAAASLRRGCPSVHRESRPLLRSGLSSGEYYRTAVRKKRRDELGRHRRRLAELGRLELRRLGEADEVDSWCDAFLTLEASGWKARAGSALASDPKTAAFFRDAIAGAFAAGRLWFLRLDLDGQPISMLISFLAPPGAFGFKLAYHEGYARFSPGMLLQIENLEILDRPDIAWTDSCADEAHPVASLWGDQRPIVRASVRLAGFRRACSYGTARLLEEGSRRIARA